MKKHIIALSIINVILLLGIGLIIIYFNVTTKDANDIYNMNINSIVEIKAYTDNVGESYGTGIIYDKNGLLITNSHVVSYTSLGQTKVFENIEIRFAAEENYQSATFVRMDTELDLAILQINNISKEYKKIKFADKTYNYGDTVYAIGNTSNYGIGISKGIISVPEVNVVYNNINRLVIQTNLDISSGNSGGALVNNKGNLIGITTFRTKDTLGNVNYGFSYSIPLKTIKEFINEG